MKRRNSISLITATTVILLDLGFSSSEIGTEAEFEPGLGCPHHGLKAAEQTSDNISEGQNGEGF